MKRTKKTNIEDEYASFGELEIAENVDVHAILTADWHIREDVPVCRTDDFIEAQWNKVREVRELQQKYDCPVLHAGDLFHHWKPSPALLTKCMENFPSEFWTVYGNHDLPQHSMDLAHKSGVTTLARSRTVDLLEEGHWNYPPKEGIFIGNRRVAVWHNMVWTTDVPFPGAEDEDEGHKVLDENPQFDLILTGDNHQQFICKQEGRLLVNPGNLTRQSAAQSDFEPCVWLYNARENSVQAHYFDIDPDAVSRVHIEEMNERDERISAFVERLDTEWEGSLDFGQNLRAFGKENKISKPVMDIAYKALES